jgi:hypothetical protein
MSRTFESHSGSISLRDQSRALTSPANVVRGRSSKQKLNRLTDVGGRAAALIRSTFGRRVAAFLTSFDPSLSGRGEGERRHPTRPRRLRAPTDGQDMQQDMQSASKLRSLSRQCGLPALAAFYMLVCTDASAQNLDAGKSAVRLFADSCVTCHRSPRGLAKGRYRVTLFMFLQDHYSATSGTAWELASYLSSVDTPQRGRSRTAAASSSAPATSTRKSSNRPPAPVPQR